MKKYLLIAFLAFLGIVNAFYLSYVSYQHWFAKTDTSNVSTEKIPSGESGNTPTEEKNDLSPAENTEDTGNIPTEEKNDLSPAENTEDTGNIPTEEKNDLSPAENTEDTGNASASFFIPQANAMPSDPDVAPINSLEGNNTDQNEPAPEASSSVLLVDAPAPEDSAIVGEHTPAEGGADIPTVDAPTPGESDVVGEDGNTEGPALEAASFESDSDKVFMAGGNPFGDKPLFCDINAKWSCSNFLYQKSALVFGIPFPMIGAVIYPILFILALWGWFSKRILPARIIAILAFLGICFNGFILYQEYLVKAFCPLCLVCTVFIIFIFFFALSIWGNDLLEKEEGIVQK